MSQKYDKGQVEDSTYYKFFEDDDRTMHGRPAWPVGEWLPSIEGELVPCENGYHACRPGDVVWWLGPRVARVSLRDVRVDWGLSWAQSKVVAREARNDGFIESWNLTEYARRIHEALPNFFTKSRTMTSGNTYPYLGLTSAHTSLPTFLEYCVPPDCVPPTGIFVPNQVYLGAVNNPGAISCLIRIFSDMVNP